MLRTQSSGAGRFADFDLNRVPSPCFVIDEVRLRANLEVLRGVSEAADTKVLLALKAAEKKRKKKRKSSSLHTLQLVYNNKPTLP